MRVRTRDSDAVLARLPELCRAHDLRVTDAGLDGVFRSVTGRATRRRRGGGVMSELVRLHARELVRDKRYFWFALLFPFAMLGIFLTIGALVPSGPGTPDFTRTVVPMALFLAVTGSALTVTSGPLAAMRERGLLRLLGTTPLGRGRLLLTHLSVRVVMVGVQAVVLLVVAVAIGALDLAAAPAVLGVTLAGLAMFLAVGLRHRRPVVVAGRRDQPRHAGAARHALPERPHRAAVAAAPRRGEGAARTAQHVPRRPAHEPDAARCTRTTRRGCRSRWWRPPRRRSC